MDIQSNENMLLFSNLHVKDVSKFVLGTIFRRTVVFYRRVPLVRC